MTPKPIPVAVAAVDSDSAPSDLAAAIAARGLIVKVFDVAGVFGLAGKPVHQVAMTILPNGEETASIRDAHKTVAEGAKQAGAGADAAAKDTDIVGNEKNIQALFRVCRRVDAKGEPTKFAAFPGPAWMRENLSTDEIATLLNLYDELKRKFGAMRLEVDDETIEAIATMLAEHVGDDIPEDFLARYPRWYLTHLAVMLAAKLAAARKSVEILLQERAVHELERAALEAELAAVRAELAAARGEAAPADAPLAPEPEPDTDPLGG